LRSGLEVGKKVPVCPFPSPTPPFPLPPALPIPPLPLKVGPLNPAREPGSAVSSLSGVPRSQTHFWHILCLGIASGCNNYKDFHTGMAVGQTEVTVKFQDDLKSADIPYWRIPSHFEPWLRRDDSLSEIKRLNLNRVYCRGWNE